MSPFEQIYSLGDLEFFITFALYFAVFVAFVVGAIRHGKSE